MQRGSDRLSVHKDEEMKHELQGLIRSGHPTRSEEWHDPEPAADDDPQVASGPVAPGAPDPVELRFELARYLGRGAFPAKRRVLVRRMAAEHAPDPLTDRLRDLPDGTTYRNVGEVAEALTGLSGR
ncbi:DUF2795 domain-containing protein [Streptomyces sp. ICBB 8177]|uniref:DUF2795 domain-containing protein n=1 Tax=Streptomyces sp. ICBB 8177 TaxID=563922 RepID=UPI000D675A8F|nr:DUF2795 domain-containing protein [Streptomyces sp. ICBB 8177]PWI41525.1 DUF2795 domain-containing protein [Streptomyces sp. ICBB 8177]